MKQLFTTLTMMLVLPLAALAQAGVHGNEIFEKSKEGAWLYYKILDEEEKTCQLQYLTYFAPHDDLHFDPYEGHVTIPGSVYGYTVTELGNGEEMLFSSLICKVTSVTIPNTVKKINASAFCYPSVLTSVEIPEGVTEIGENAFGDVYTLTSVSIPSSVKSIGKAAFIRCRKLKDVTLSEGLELIGRSCFSACLELEEIHIPSTVSVIGDFGFEACHALRSINLPEGITVIGNYLFEGCWNLESVIIPENVWFIGEMAFCACFSLKSLTIPAGVSVIGPMAFWATGENNSQFDLYSLIEDPPLFSYEISDKSIQPDKFRSVLHVPMGTLEEYKYKPGWKGFDDYEEFNTTGIGQVRTEPDSEAESHYSLEGRKLKAPVKGLNIVKMADGTVKKVIVR